MTYVPSFTDSSCIVITNSDTIRVYDNVPTQNSNVNYTDYYINSNYIFNRGSAYFSQYSTLPQCQDNSRFTTEVYYRNDFSQILIIFAILSIVSLYLPWKIFTRLFWRLK